jgi:hypothetical protein
MHHAAFRSGFHLSAGPLAADLTAQSDAAARAAKGYTLELAQALGDFNSLDATGRRALHIHLPRPDTSPLERALGSLLDARC